jgi:hypothetical protein
MARDARKSLRSGVVPPSKALTRQIDAISIVLRIGLICTGLLVARP